MARRKSGCDPNRMGLSKEEEPEAQKMSRFDPSVNSHRPASVKTQDISHVLASIFKDVYTKDIIRRDTLSNLIKSKRGQSSHHERYVEELQQVHSEYNKCIKQANKLERHLIKARARAAATEREAYGKIREEMGDVQDHQGLFVVQSAFSNCVDSDLLAEHNLISPLDYLPIPKPQVNAPAAVKFNYAKPTVSFNMHVSREPQDDGYTLIPSPEKMVPERNMSENSLTIESTSDAPKRIKSPKEKMDPSKPKQKWKDKPSSQDQMEGVEKLQRLKDCTDFLRNPRFLPPTAQQGGGSLIQPKTKAGRTDSGRKGTAEQSSTSASVPVFLAKPSVVLFSEYTVGQVYETTLELKNVTSASRHVRVIPPTTTYFAIGLGRFPGEGGIVAPGMSCKYMVRFAPESLGGYEDFVTVETQGEDVLVVPIKAERPPPVLTLPRVMDCGYCLIGGVKFVEFLCQNVGLSVGKFCVIPKDQWPAWNIRSLAKTYFSEKPPFAVSPSLFVLQPGEAVVVEVAFFPSTAEKSCQDFTIVCDNCQVKDVSIQGEGQEIALELLSVSGKQERPMAGEACDLTAEHSIRFSPSNPHSGQEKKVVIRNNTHVELPFHWQIMKPNLRPMPPVETPEPSQIQFQPETDNAFQISPFTGVFAPYKEKEFLLTFRPKELKNYHSVCHLVLSDIPQPPPEAPDESVLPPVHTGARMSDVIVMEIEVKGPMEPYKILLEPYAVVIPGEVFIFTTIRRQFKMWNHSRTFITFQWEDKNSGCHTIEVEPSSGRIEENECFDINLSVTGGKPERFVTSLVCRIAHHPEPVTLALEVTFKGPIVTLSVPSVDFGLMELGRRTQTSLLLTNVTQLEASWTLTEIHDHKDSQISIEPCRGVLQPSATCSVDVLFVPRFCQQFQTELQLSVENGTGCHLLVRGDVQSPLVCLLNCKLLLPEIYVGVPVRGTVTIFNQTLLPTQFRWMPKLQGKHAERCSATFDPISATLGPNVKMNITVNFITHIMEATEVAALCEVQGMRSPLALSIAAPKPRTLSVSYSLPDSRPCSDEEDPSTLLLNFGDDIIMKRTVTKQLLMTNRTAIAAPFTIEAEYFNCWAPDSHSLTEERHKYITKPLHSMRAKKLEEKTNEEFMNRMLANGKGAAFFVSPHAGTLGPLETQTVNITAYTEMWGKYRDNLLCKVGDLEAVSIPMQMSVTGCPLYFQMIGPSPDGQTQTLNIHFGTHISGGDTVSRAVRINNPTFMEICMDWETYNVDLDDSADVSYEVPPRPDAEGTMKLREETPDSKGASTSSESIVDTPSDEKIKKETPDSKEASTSSESIVIQDTSSNNEEKNETPDSKESSATSQSIEEASSDMKIENVSPDTKESSASPKGTVDTPSNEKTKNGTPDSKAASTSSKSIADTSSNKKKKNGTPDSKESSASSKGTVGTPSKKKIKNGTPDSKAASTSSESIADMSSNKKKINGTPDSKESRVSSKGTVDTPSNKKIKNGTPDSKGASTSSESVVIKNETPDSKEEGASSESIVGASLNNEEKNETLDSKESSASPQSIEDTSLDKKILKIIECLDSKESSASFHSIVEAEEEGIISEDLCKKEETPSSVYITPPVGTLADYPYCVTPQQTVIPARGSSTVHVSFTPLTLPESVSKSRCVGVALGFVRLSETAACVLGKVDRAQGLELEPIRVDLLAAVKPAALCVQMDDDEQVLEFHASAGDLLIEQPGKKTVLRDFDVIQTFELRNNLELLLHFKLETQSPFIVLKPQPRACTRNSSDLHKDDSQYLFLQPQQRMVVKVAFRCTPSLLGYADQAEEEVPPDVMLIQSERSQRTLKFQQDLLIRYSNNSLQTVPLQACLDLPTVSLSTDTIDFGFCYVAKTKTVEVDLHSQGTYIYWTSVIDSDNTDPGVFRVAPELGLMKFKTPQSTSWNQILRISFTPSEDGEFRAVVVIKCPLVKTALTLQLLGKGSFDELYRSSSAVS